MRHMGISGKIAIGAFFAALALLALTGITLHETVGLWFLAASVAAYVACVAEVVIRRRHRTLVASGIGSILVIAFGIAFLRQWGLAFNADPDAMSARVDSDRPDLYFYLAAASGAATLLLLFAGTVLPGRGPRGAASAPRRRPASTARGAAPRRPATRSSASRQAPRDAAARPAPPRPAAKAPAPRTQSARVPAPRAASSGVKRSAPSAGGASASKPSASKSPAKSPARPSARTSPRR